MAPQTRSLIVAVLLMATALAAPAAAQTPPTVDEIISRLTPSGPLPGTLRGIRATSPGQAPQTPVVTQPPAIDLVVNFASNSAELTPAARGVLANLGAALTSPALSGGRFRIEGHTDTMGTAAFNLALSERRAAAVAAFLVTGYQVAPDHLETVGLGFTQLAVATAPGVDEPRNRRVRVVNITRSTSR